MLYAYLCISVQANFIRLATTWLNAITYLHYGTVVMASFLSQELNIMTPRPSLSEMLAKKSTRNSQYFTSLGRITEFRHRLFKTTLITSDGHLSNNASVDIRAHE